MLPILRCLLLIFLALGLPAFAQERLRVGFFDLTPHIREAKQAGVPVGGPAVEYLQSIGQRMGVRFEFDREALPLDRLLFELQSGALDVVLALGKSPERESLGRFPARPFFQMQPSLMVLSTSPLLAIKQAENLLSLRIGVYSAGYLSPLLRQPQLHLEKMYGRDVILRNFRKMQAGRLDAVYSPDAFDLASVAAAQGFSAKVRILGLPENPVGLYSVFANRLDPRLVRKYEVALAQMEPYAQYLERAMRAAQRD